jgi:KDO2-lipid IV(A) lauroyltransferase
MEGYGRAGFAGLSGDFSKLRNMETQESYLRDVARLFVWYPFRWSVSSLPAAAAIRILTILGKIHCYLCRSQRQVVIRNLRRTVGKDWSPALLQNAARRYFETHYVSQLVVFLFPKLNPENIGTIHSFDGIENLRKGLEEKRGCVLLHAHFGPIHLPLFHLGLLGYEVKQLGYLRKPQGLSRVGEKVSYRLRQKYENFIPARIIQANRFLRDAVRHLKDNGVLMATGDGTGRGEFVGKFEPVSFLGKNMLFPIGPAKLARITNSSIIPMFTVKQTNNSQYITVIEEPILSEDLNNSDNEMEIILKFASMLESYIRKYPHLWHFWDEFSRGKLIV